MPRYQTLFLEYKVNFKPRYGHGKPPHKLLYDIIDGNRKEYIKFLEGSLPYKDKIQEIKSVENEKDSIKPVWNNGFLPGLDIIGIYSMLANYSPSKYVEVGSGNSTKVARKCKLENDLSTEIICIDPVPRVEIDSVADKIINKPFEDSDYDFIFDLEKDDILFIDNSHRILPNSDSTVFYLEILPRLKKGVIVHIHDIYLPYDYPQFMCDRFYSEQYGLAMFLLANHKKYKAILPNYFISEDKELSEIVMPFWDHPELKNVERHGGSFWLQIT